MAGGPGDRADAPEPAGGPSAGRRGPRAGTCVLTVPHAPGMVVLTAAFRYAERSEDDQVRNSHDEIEGRGCGGGWDGIRGLTGPGGGREAMARAGRGAIASGEAGGVAGVAMARAGREVSTGGEGRWWAGERQRREYRQGAGAWAAVSRAATRGSASVRSERTAA